jgi:hypothetical protein
MFELATELLPQKQQQSGGVETEAETRDGAGPIAFIASLRQNDALAPWAPAVSEDLFISLFLVLGAARRNWYDAPRKPLDVERHCALARAIDAFGRAEQFVWSGVDVIAWVRGGGLMFHNGRIARVGGVDDEMEEDSGGEQESDSDDGRFAGSMSSFVGEDMEDEMEDGVDALFAGQMRSMTVEDASKGREDKGDAAAREREDARRKLDLTLDQVVESMRLLNIAFDEVALAESFAALRIHDGEWPGRRQKEHRRFF